MVLLPNEGIYRDGTPDPSIFGTIFRTVDEDDDLVDFVDALNFVPRLTRLPGSFLGRVIQEQRERLLLC
jgi:homogentisate 1,2-dioxygenase